MPEPRFTRAQTAYAADPAARVTCAHLRPIEDEAREQGIDVLLTVEAPPTIFIRALDPGPAALGPLRLDPGVRHEPSRVIGPHSWSDPAYRCRRCGGAVEFHQGGWSNDPPEMRARARRSREPSRSRRMGCGAQGGLSQLKSPDKLE